MENIPYEKQKVAFFVFKKTLFIAALCTALLSIAPQTVFADITQSRKITLVVRDVTVKDAIETIKKQSDYSFFIDTEEVDVHKKVSVNMTNKSVREILDIIFQGQKVKYEVKGNHIIVSSDRALVSEKAMSEKKRITGVVTDEKGEPAIGANIMVKGTTQGVVTDVDGNYSVMVASHDVLIVSYIGYQTQEIPVKGKSVLKVVLAVDSELLEEVVVVGYGVQKKVNLTGSVSTVKFSEQSDSRPITNVSSALAGLSSGVSVMQGSGQPGEDKATIRVRGVGTLNNSDPLVIIDGMEGDLNLLNPSDIESVSILKDAASASIYGSRAANGVVLVTTKKGNKDRINISYSGNFSIAKPSNLVDLVSDYPAYMKLVNESARNTGSPEIFSTKTINTWEEANRNPNGVNENGIPNWLAYPNTNWQREMYQSNLSQNHSLSVDGGSSKTSFLLSAGYMDNPGLVENTGLKRYTFRANLQASVTDWLTVGTNTYAVLQSTELGDYKSMNNIIAGHLFPADFQLFII